MVPVVRASELLARLRTLGVRVWVEGAELKISAPKGVLTDELKEALRERWMGDADPMALRAGWTLTAERVAKDAGGLDLGGLLDRIEAEMGDADDAPQWTMNTTLAEIGIHDAGEHQIYGPDGCAACNYTGYRGRLGIFELMQVDDEIRALVSQNVDSKTIRSTAVRKGMHTLRSDGARKVLAGRTSVAEVLRATEEEAAVAQI